jgi:hypothetical protein
VYHGSEHASFAFGRGSELLLSPEVRLLSVDGEHLHFPHQKVGLPGQEAVPVLLLRTYDGIGHQVGLSLD